MFGDLDKFVTLMGDVANVQQRMLETQEKTHAILQSIDSRLEVLVTMKQKELCEVQRKEAP